MTKENDMKIKTKDLEGPALAYAIAQFTPDLMQIGNCFYIRDAEGERVLFNPAGNWSQGGPIIEREKIDTEFDPNGAEVVMARLWRDKRKYRAYGPTPLIAAMRAFVVSKLGDEPEVPDALT